MKLFAIHEEKLNSAQLDDIITKVKLMLKEVRVPVAIYKVMRQFGYGENADIFNQIRAEMTRRSALRASKASVPAPKRCDNCISGVGRNRCNVTSDVIAPAGHCPFYKRAE